MKMCNIILLVLLLGIRSISGQTGNVAYCGKNFKYDNVVIYEFKKGNKGWVVENQKVPIKSIYRKKELSNSQIDTLNAWLQALTTTKSDLISQKCIYCYIGIVYYFDNEIVANFSISNDCNVFILYSREGKSNSFANTILSFTEMQRVKLNKLCQKLGLLSK